MFQILVVGDDKDTRKLVEAVLKGNGFHPIMACSGGEVLKLLDRHLIDLAVLDIMMPSMDRHELTKQLRASDYNLSILMVTAEQLPEDKRKGFIVGTDDYMTKPADEEEMILCVKALLRHTQIASERRIMIGDMILNYGSLIVTRDSDSRALLRGEFYLLHKLLFHPDKIFTRIQLIDEMWGMESESDDDIISVHINRLRKCFEAYPEFTIETACGLGYKAVRNAWRKESVTNRCTSLSQYCPW